MPPAIWLWPPKHSELAVLHASFKYEKDVGNDKGWSLALPCFGQTFPPALLDSCQDRGFWRAWGDEQAQTQ